jgi:hypothetical protein
MDSKNFTTHSEKQMISAPVLIIGGIAAAWLLPRLFGAKRSLPSKPPPIIVKSGSFTIETDQPLHPPGKNRPQYRRRNFRGIKGIRVIWYNEIVKNDRGADDFEENKDWSDRDDVQVKIDLLYCDPTTGGCNPGPQVILGDDGLDVLLETPIKLSDSRGKKHRKRKAVREDEQAEIVIFGAVEIVNKSNGNRIKFYPETEGREYIIGIYDELGTRR